MTTINDKTIDLFRKFIDDVIDTSEEPTVYFTALNIRDAVEYMLADNTEELALYAEDAEKGMI